MIMTHSMLVPSHKPSNNTILATYGKALRSLQDAVNELNSRCAADVLCAVGMLALCEVRGVLFVAHVSKL
jgi:hypothetical protein